MSSRTSWEELKHRPGREHHFNSGNLLRRFVDASNSYEDRASRSLANARLSAVAACGKQRRLHQTLVCLSPRQARIQAIPEV